jgi:hypothetical protein
MIKKEVTFENLEGEKVTRAFWFNLNKAELAKMQVKHLNFQSYIQAAIDSDNMERVIAVFDELLAMSYGVRDEDGITFRKSEDLWDAFKNSDAYSELFIDLLGNPHKAGAFFAGLVPREFQEGVTEAMKKSAAQVVDVANIFEQDLSPDTSEPVGSPTHEVPQPAVDIARSVPPQPVNEAQFQLSRLTEEQKVALRAELGI